MVRLEQDLSRAENRHRSSSHADEALPVAHPLHCAVADFLDPLVASLGCKFVTDPACRGNQRIPLFLSSDRRRDTWLCDVDALVLAGDEVRLIVEVDESNVKPTHLAGKFLTSAMSRFYIHRTEGDVPRPMHRDCCFLQFVSTLDLEPKSRKVHQWRNIEAAIRKLPPIGDVREYHLFCGTPADGLDADTQQQVTEVVSRVLSGGAAPAP
jgi:hypothetical protein